MELKVIKLDNDFVKGETEYERYAFTNWKNISEILKDDPNDEEGDLNNIECIVKISNGRKRVYRKCRSNKITKDKIALGYRTALELGVKQDNNEEVVVKSSWWFWFPYLWHHIDSTIKWPFRIAVVAFICTVLSFLETIMNLINILK